MKYLFSLVPFIFFHNIFAQSKKFYSIRRPPISSCQIRVNGKIIGNQWYNFMLFPKYQSPQFVLKRNGELFEIKNRNDSSFDQFNDTLITFNYTAYEESNSRWGKVRYDFTPLVVLEWWVNKKVINHATETGHLQIQTKVFDMTERSDYPKSDYYFVPFTDHLATGANADEYNFWYTKKIIRGRQDIINGNHVKVRCKIDYSRILN